MLEMKLDLIADMEKKVKETLDQVDTMFMTYEAKMDSQIDIN